MDSNFSPISDDEFWRDTERASTPTPFDDSEAPRSSTPNANSKLLNNSNPNDKSWNEFQEQESEELNLSNCPDPTLTEEQFEVDESPFSDPPLRDEQSWLENSGGEQFESEKFEQSLQHVGAGDISDEDAGVIEMDIDADDFDEVPRASAFRNSLMYSDFKPRTPKTNLFKFLRLLALHLKKNTLSSQRIFWAQNLDDNRNRVHQAKRSG